MVIKELSDEAYLAFQMKYGDNSNVVGFYLRKTIKFTKDKVLVDVSELAGYVSVEGVTDTSDNGPILIHEPALDIFLAPIRKSKANGTMKLQRMREDNGSIAFQTNQLLTKEDENNLENGTASAIFHDFAAKSYIIMKR